MLEVFISSFVLYFVVIDPIGTIPIFVALTVGMTERAKTRMALEGTVIAGIILIIFALIGSQLLTYLGITLAAFKIGGGLILFHVALEMLSSKRMQRKEKAVQSATDSPPQTNDSPLSPGSSNTGSSNAGPPHFASTSITPASLEDAGNSDSQNVSSVYPLAIPLLAGPAAIVSVIVISSQNIHHIQSWLSGLAALGATIAITALLLLATARMDRFINRKAAEVITRVMAILLATLSVQYVLEGLADLSLITLS